MLITRYLHLVCSSLSYIINDRGGEGCVTNKTLFYFYLKIYINNGLKSTRLTINFKIKTTFFIRDMFRFFSNHFQTKQESRIGLKNPAFPTNTKAER